MESENSLLGMLKDWRFTPAARFKLTRENNESAGKTWVWVYDNGGNILSKTEYAYTTGELGEALSTVNYTYGDSSWGDLLTAYNGVPITHDEIGNPLNDGTWTYTWNGRQLASMTDDTTTWSYKYNADGLRTEKTDGTTTYKYVYSGDKLIQMSVGNDVLKFTYDGSTPATVTYNGSTYYYVTNLQGDVVAIVSWQGRVMGSYSYDAWGNVSSSTGFSATLTQLNPLRYRAYVYDYETGLYYLQSRYYNARTGRFLNADSYASTGQGILGHNMFAYCLSNPINLADPTGNSSIATKIHEIVSGIIEACLTVRYDVPLYSQGTLDLCWAYCQAMVEDFGSGIAKTQEEADARAIEIAISVHGEKDADGNEIWNRGGWPTNMGDHIKINGILDLFLLLQDGPVYAYYWSGKRDTKAHLVVVTGVNVLDSTVYTNNPWGNSGEQSFNDFMQGFYGKPSTDDMPLYSIIPISN